MARFQVGEAFLQVTASLKGLHKKIRAEVQAWDDLTVDVTPDMRDFHEEVREETANLDDVEVDVDASMAGFHRRVRAETSSLPEAQVNVEPVVDTVRARARVITFSEEVKRRLDAATRALGEIRIDGDAGPIERKIWTVRQRLNTLQNQRIGIDIDADAAIREITAIQVMLTALARQSPNVQVRVDTARALAQLAALRAGFDGADRNMSVFSRTLGVVGTGFGLFTRGVGTVVSGLGDLIGEGTKVGSTLTSLGTRIGSGGTGVVGNLGSLGSTAGTAGTAFVGLVATATPLIAMLVGIAGAGAIAVAGIGQLGGAAIALLSGLVPLAGTLGLLPGLIIPVAGAVGVLAIAFGDEGLKKEVEGLKQAFAPLVSDIRDQMRPALTELINSVETLVPVFRRASPAITSAISEVTDSFSDMFRSSSFQSDLETILTGARRQILDFGSIAQSGMRAFIDIIIEAQPAVNSLTNYLRQGATDLQSFIAEARRTGELRVFFQQAVDVLINFMGVVRNIGGLFVDLWESANRTGAFMAVLGALNDGVSRFRDYVDDAGGAWDRLMARAGPATESLVNLIGSIGQAFAEMGAEVDIVPLIDQIASTIRNLIPVFQEIGNAAVPVFERMVVLFEDLAIAIGPDVSQILKDMGLAIEAIAPSLESIIPAIGAASVEFLKVVAVVGNFIDHLVTLPSIAKKALHLDFAGAKAEWDGLQERTQKVAESLGQIGQSAGTATPPVNDLRSSIESINPERTVTLNVEAGAALGEAQAVGNAVLGVPQDWLTRFAGDPTGLNAAIAAATGGIAAVQAEHLTAFFGDTGSILASADAAQNGISSVPPDHLTGFQGDASSVLSAAGSATSGVNSVPSQHHTPITGDAASAVGESQRAGQAISGIPRPGPIPINVQDNASGVLDNLLAKLRTFASTAWRAAVSVVTPGQAIGGIMASMACGGIVTMARGDTLSPMRGGVAQLVPPNTWRVIGDRMQGMEAYIPVNRSALSMMILDKTARLMGRVLIPERWLPLVQMLAPVLGLARGRVLQTDDSGRPVAWSDDPDPGAFRYPREQRRPDFSMSWLSQLLRQFITPTIERLMGTRSLEVSTLVGTWRQQTSAIQETLGQARRPRHDRSSRLLVQNRGTATPTGWLPPGYDNGYSSLRLTPPRSGSSDAPGATAVTGAVPSINVYAQPQQSEEAVAMMVTRRLAFALRT